MKKLFSIILASLCLGTANAQIPEGFYHIKNVNTDRYLSISDTNPNNYEVNKTSGSVNLAGLRTLLNYDTVAVSPACVVYICEIEGKPGKYNLAGQGSSFYELTDYRLPIDITETSAGLVFSGTYNGFTKELMDRSPSEDDGYIVSTDTGMKFWEVLEINTTDEYIGIRPDVKTAEGEYYGTIYAGFDFKLASEGMKAYYVNKAGGAGFTMTEIKDEVIKTGEPVIVKCNSADPKDNKILPTFGGTVLKDNLLGGVYCSLKGVAKHTNVTEYNPVTMRVLGLSEKGELAFVKAQATDLYKDLYLKANKAYLKVNPSDAEVMVAGASTGINTVKAAAQKNDEGTYTLTGIRLSENATPKAGIYIKDGKKVVIK